MTPHDASPTPSPQRMLLARESATPPHAPPRTEARPLSVLHFVPTLLRKNWWLKKKHPVGLLLEILTPMIFILIMSVIKHQTTEYDVPAGFSDDNRANSLFGRYGYSILAPSFTPEYVIPETTLTGLLLQLSVWSFTYRRDYDTFPADARDECEALVVQGGQVSLNASSPYALPDVCDGRVSPLKLAIAPDTEFTRDYFYETVRQWYPTVEIQVNGNQTLVVPSLEDSVVFYDTEADLEEYIKSAEYATTAEQPRIFGAIVFNEFPTGDRLGSYAPIEYSLRMNATYFEQDDDERLVPTTVFGDASSWKSYRRSLQTQEYQEYTANGFMTLQTLVARFVNCMPEWDSDSKTTTGSCQATDSTAVSSDDLDARLLQSVTNDPATKQTASYIPGLILGESIEVSLSDSAAEALLVPLRQAPQPYLGSTTSPFPINSYTKSTFYDVVENVFPIFFILAYMSTLSKIMVSLIAERETRSRELMKILGVSESSIVISWYLTYFVILFVSCIAQVVAAKFGTFEQSDVVVLFVFFFLFSLSILAYAFLVSTVFSKARTGAYVGIVVFFLFYAVSNVFNESSSESSKNAAGILSPVALVFAIKVLSKAETSGVGITFSNMSSVVENFRFSTALLQLAFDTVLYTVIGLYLEKVVPKAYGTTEKWYFPLMPSYWNRRRRIITDPMAADGDNGANCNVSVSMNPNVEEPSADLVNQERNGMALSIQGMRKQFSVPGGTKVAVQGMHLNMYTGQISCLLGHNGAGKTTLISMLTGVLPATEGDAYFRGLSVRENMDEIRKSLGICFQHDVLYPELTVADHIEFYARIKGYKGEQLRQEVDKKISEVGLADKRDVMSTALSGGMKRKLSVAIALLGDSTLVFLDEPTSGMDPYSRRSIWEFLMNNRHDRVLVLTTHFMDEADVLGDRIAIMAEGELRCCGSPLFLKNRYGAGYNLTIVKEEDCDDAKVISFVLDRIPTGRVLSNVGTEVSFQLPLDTSSKFPELFKSLDVELKNLGLLSYGISVTTMEEVFIKVAESGDDTEGQHTLQNKIKEKTAVLPSDSSSTSNETNTPHVTKNTSESTFFTQFVALLQKRFRIAKRDKKFGFVSLFLPIAWLVFGLSLLQAGELSKTDPSMALNVDDLATEVSGNQVLLPSFCTSAGDWCNQAISSTYFTGAVPVDIKEGEIGNPPYKSETPTVFGVEYTSSEMNATDARGYLLKLSEVIFDRGFTQNIVGQFGGFLVHADDDAHVLSYNVLVNTSLDHGSAVFKGLMDQSIYRVMASKVSSNVDIASLTLKVNSYPLPQTASTASLYSSYLSFSACIFIAIAFGYYPASIVVLLVKERESQHNSKHQQLVSGARLLAFWLANYVWDLLVYCIPGGVALVLIQAYDLSALTGSEKCLHCSELTYPAVVVLFVLFGFAICPYSYCLSFVFSEHATAQSKVITVNFIVGLVFMIVSFMFDVIDSIEGVGRVLKWFFRFSPLYDLSAGLLDMTIFEIVSNGVGEFETERSSNPFALENAGYEMVFLVIDAVIFFSIAVGIDYGLTFPKFKSILTKDPQIAVDPEDEDEDVLSERDRMLTERASSDVIKLQNLRKVYRKGEKVAVKNLSFGLKRGECFGFLGINGAGKTTTMKMLTGDIVPTSGRATLSGFDILTQQLEVRRQIGYCPQFDALIDLLSVREHLELFAQIKGIPRSELQSVVQDKLHQLNLTAFEDKLAGTLSGGNKRKLSVAIAMIGSPSILFLDEPSTGMDPVSRRFMWDVISEISTQNRQSTVVLTTHSMEECEALCTRVGIMVGGGLKCLGSVQHVKNRFGDGLMLDAKLQPPQTHDIKELVLRHFDNPDSQISTDQLTEMCGLFGQPSWEQKIANTHPTGFLLANQFDRDGYVPATSFATWWLGETAFENVLKFLKDNFGNVELLERRHDSCWFKIHGETIVGETTARGEQLKLSNVFDVIESSKDVLSIREYSVSQTTLEQIFNTFASQQNMGAPISSTPTPSADGQTMF